MKYEKIRDLITRQNGFTEHGYNTMNDFTKIKNKRIQIDMGGLGDIDLHNFCEDLCAKNCEITQNYNAEENPHCCEDDPSDLCIKCEISMMYLAYYKLFLIEELMREEDEERVIEERVIEDGI